MKLTDVKAGKRGEIRRINCEIPLKNRLKILGVFEGVEVEILRYAPFSGPVEILVRGYRLAIRKSQAEKIEVEVYNE